MAQEKARRKARGRGVQEPEPARYNPVQPSPEPVRPAREPECPEYVAPAQTERVAEATFAARVARVARENPNQVGQRQSHQQQTAPSHSKPFGSNDDFTGTWMDDVGNDYVLEQRGSIVTEHSATGQSGCGMAVRNELTMYGRVGILADDLIRWSDGGIWARSDLKVPSEMPPPPRRPAQSTAAASAASAAAELGAKPWKNRGAYEHRLPPDLANLVTPGPGSEEDGRFVGRGRMTAHVDKEEAEQRLWFAPWMQGPGL